jgi:hypothetical protein
LGAVHWDMNSVVVSIYFLLKFSFIGFLRWTTEASATPNVRSRKSLNFSGRPREVENVEVGIVENVETVEAIE